SLLEPQVSIAYQANDSKLNQQNKLTLQARHENTFFRLKFEHLRSDFKSLQPVKPYTSKKLP
ncbi:hypothetical protein, partial [Vibrio sp. Vb0877]|uniref:hypothetical protein n=1 Tax=Vibrio sp. Vb0877 TaxID=2816073 RepID=UPI001A8CFA92